MRNETEMFNLVLSIAKEDERIRAVLMSGSRANPDCPKDEFQDYDIIYYVTDVAPFYDNMDWIIEKFGHPAIMQMPESMELIPPDGDGCFVYLMIFEDGNRIDLTVTKSGHIDDGEPAVVLLDKDGFLSDIQVKPDYWYIKKPTQKLFSDCCNEFWSAVFTACELFRETALDIAGNLGFSYNHDEDRAMMSYLTRTRNGMKLKS